MVKFLKIKFFIFSLLLCVLFSCNMKPDYESEQDRSIKPYNAQGTSVPADSIKPPVVKLMDKSQLITTSISNFEQFPGPTASNGKTESKSIKAGLPRVVIPGQDSFALPNTTLARDSSFIAAEADEEVAKDMVQSDENNFAFSYFGKLQGLRHDVIKCLMTDRKGNLWIGTGGGGLCRYNGRTFSHFSEKQGLPGTQVFSALEDRSGNIWMGIFGGGICRYDGHSMSIYSEKQGLPSNKVLC
jgi:hypothetical protein